MSLNIKLKRSAVAGSAPAATQLEDGELAVNYNETDPAIYLKDSTGAVVRIAGDGAVGSPQITGTSPIEVDNTDTQRPDVSITPATASAAGSMSAADKTKLDGVEDGAQANVNADWNAASGDAEILNKPTIPADQVNSDWNATTGVEEILNKPAIPAAQVNSDWDATTGVAEILNKPSIIPEAPADGKTYGRKDAAWSEVEPGGVTQIVAGNNVTISPTGGTGVVTVNSTGGGGAWTEGTNQLYPTDAANAVLIGGTLPSSPNITLNADGSIDTEADAIINGITVGKGAGAPSYSQNTAIGNSVLLNTTGEGNTALGQSALRNTTTGQLNTAVGRYSLFFNISGSDNTAVGTQALYNSTTGYDNTAVGSKAAESITTGRGNSAFGESALLNLEDGIFNTIVGHDSGTSLVTGDRNTSLGYFSLKSCVSGSGNVAIGNDALQLATGSSNVAIGNQAGDQMTTGINNTCIGYEAQPSAATVSNEITLGHTTVTKFRVPGINFILKDNAGTPTEGQVLTADIIGEGYWADPAVTTTFGTSVPVYADNAAATSGGLINGDVYRKSDGTMMIVF